MILCGRSRTLRHMPVVLQVRHPCCLRQYAGEGGTTRSGDSDDGNQEDPNQAHKTHVVNPHGSLSRQRAIKGVRADEVRT